MQLSKFSTSPSINYTSVMLAPAPANRRRLLSIGRSRCEAARSNRNISANSERARQWSTRQLCQRQRWRRGGGCCQLPKADVQRHGQIDLDQCCVSWHRLKGRSNAQQSAHLGLEWIASRKILLPCCTTLLYISICCRRAGTFNAHNIGFLRGILNRTHGIRYENDFRIGLHGLQMYYFHARY